MYFASDNTTVAKTVFTTGRGSRISVRADVRCTKLHLMKLYFEVMLTRGIASVSTRPRPNERIRADVVTAMESSTFGSTVRKVHTCAIGMLLENNYFTLRINKTVHFVHLVVRKIT